MDTVEVNATALLTVLAALNGPAYYVLELQATRKLHRDGVINDNPIEILIADYAAASEKYLVEYKAAAAQRNDAATRLLNSLNQSK